MTARRIFRSDDIAVDAIPDPSEDRMIIRTTQEVGPLLHAAERLRNETTGKGKTGAFKESGELPASLIEDEALKQGINWWTLPAQEQAVFCKRLLRKYPAFRTSPGSI